MKTKQYLIKTLGCGLLFLASACSDVLEQTPQTALLATQAFDNPAHIELSVVGVYDAAQSGFYAGGAVRGYPFGAAHVEQGDNRGEDVVNTQAFFLITYNNTYDPTSPNNDYHFQTLFALVNKANAVLTGLASAVPTTGLTQAQIDAYQGECRFMRALAYHELMKHFCKPYSDNPTAANGGMPYRTTAITDAASANAALSMPRGTVQEDYVQILADLDYAESVLPNTRTGSLKITRATKAAAVALKTRVKLHMMDWAGVVTEGNKLATQSVAPFTPNATYGSYSLPSSPFAAFTATGSKSNTESIFSIENDATDNPGVNGALPSMYNTSASPTSGRALVAISPLIWNQTWFLATDTRKGSTFVNINVEGTTAGGKGGYFTKKYSDVVGGSDNAPVLRYAEVLLNMAEAIQRQNGSPDARAFALFNAVRSRSNAAGTDASYDQLSDFATANALTQAILNERRIEFLCEGLRWGDIHRLAQDATFNSWGGGIPAKITPSNITNYRPYYTGDPTTNATIMASTTLRQNAIAYSNYKFLWPIPSSETILNPTLAAQQNPGW